MKKISRFIHHYLVPSHRNNFRAKTLHLDTLTIVVAFFLLLSFTLSKTSTTGILGVATDVNIDRLYQKTNEERAARGLQPLDYNSQLAAAAQGKAQHMFTHNYWDHFAPDGTSPWDFINGSGYSYKFAGENLAYNFMFSDDVVRAWIDSPTHAENLFNPDFTNIGFAVLNGNLLGEETTVVVQMFGTPNQQSVAQAPAESNSFVPPAQAEEIAPNAPAEESAAPQESIVVEETVPEAPETNSEDTDNLVITSATAPPAIGNTNGISLNGIKFNTSTVIIGLLLFVLFIDLFIALRMKHIRVTGKNLAHILFLGAILLGVYIVKNGAIL